MYLSRLILNPRSRQVRSEMADLYEMHRTVMHAFASQIEADERVLFRLDIHPRSGIPSLLVQSQHMPSWAFLSLPGKDYLLPGDELPAGVENPAVKAVNLSFESGQVLAFRLRANPTVKKDRPDEKQGRRVGVRGEEEQRNWLARKIEAGGGHLLSAAITQGRLEGGKLHHGAIRHDLKLLVVQFEGVLQVREPEKLLQMLQAGIGSGKGLGFGMLSLAPAGA